MLRIKFSGGRQFSASKSPTSCSCKPLPASVADDTTNIFSQNDTIEGKWSQAGFSNTLRIYENGLIYTYYCTTGNCDSLYNTYEAADGNHIPGIDGYTLQNGILTIDNDINDTDPGFALGSVTFSCEGNIYEIVTSQNMATFVRLNTNLDDCNSVSITEETLNSSFTTDKYYDLLGREIKDITTYPIHSLYIKNGKKYIKAQ